jgi:hypothetical protein
LYKPFRDVAKIIFYIGMKKSKGYVWDPAKAQNPVCCDGNNKKIYKMSDSQAKIVIMIIPLIINLLIWCTMTMGKYDCS